MKTIVSLPGIHCEGCANLIKDVSTDFPEITKIDVDLASKKVALEYEDTFDLASWSAAVEELGETYRVHLIA